MAFGVTGKARKKDKRNGGREGQRKKIIRK